VDPEKKAELQSWTMLPRFPSNYNSKNLPVQRFGDSSRLKGALTDAIKRYEEELALKSQATLREQS
jgi:hypothetical protein